MPRFTQPALPSILMFFLLAEFFLVSWLTATGMSRYTFLRNAHTVIGADVSHCGLDPTDIVGVYSEGGQVRVGHDGGGDVDNTVIIMVSFLRRLWQIGEVVY